MDHLYIISTLVGMSPAPDGAPNQAEAFVVQMIMLGAIFFFFYFLMIRPQTKKSQETKEMQVGLQKGDRVLTTGGIYGSVHKTADDVVTVEIAEGVRIKMRRTAISEITKKTDNDEKEQS